MPEIPAELRSYKPETREKIRRGLCSALEVAAREACGRKPALFSGESVRVAAGADSNACNRAFKAWKAGLLSVGESWAGEESAKRPEPAQKADASGLGERVRVATTDGDREELLHELAALVADGQVDPVQAREIRGSLAEARQAADAKRANEPPPEDPRRMLLASPQAMDAARAIDRIVDDARFDRVLAFIAAEVEADKIQHPNTDEGA